MKVAKWFIQDSLLPFTLMYSLHFPISLHWSYTNSSYTESILRLGLFLIIIIFARVVFNSVPPCIVQSWMSLWFWDCLPSFGILYRWFLVCICMVWRSSCFIYIGSFRLSSLFYSWFGIFMDAWCFRRIDFRLSFVILFYDWNNCIFFFVTLSLFFLNSIWLCLIYLFFLFFLFFFFFELSFRFRYWSKWLSNWVFKRAWRFW